MSEFKVGDVVKVRDPKQFISTFEKKVTDRVAIVERVGPDSHGQFKERVTVMFQKKKGRGKEWREHMSVRDMELVSRP